MGEKSATGRETADLRYNSVGITAPIRDEQVVPFEAVTEIDALNTTIAATGPDRTVQAPKA